MSEARIEAELAKLPGNLSVEQRLKLLSVNTLLDILEELRKMSAKLDAIADDTCAWSQHKGYLRS